MGVIGMDILGCLLVGESSMSQSSIILKALQDAQGKWVSLVELSQCSGSYAVSERVSELRRKQGFDIENRVDVEPDGRKFSFYRLHQPAYAEVMKENL
jgi:biotin operon repressor